MNDQLILLLQQAKAQWGIETVQAIRNKINEEGLIFQSNLVNSIAYEQDDTLDGNISFKMTDYGKFLDEGVNGTLTNVGSQFSFKGNWKGTAVAIKEWADSKNLNNWALGHSIQKKGIQPRKFFNSVIESRIPNLATNLDTAYRTYLNNMINNQLNP